MKYAEAGTVSHGTLRSEDLISAFESLLRELSEVNNKNYVELLKEANAWLIRNTTQGGMDPEPAADDQELGSALVDELSDALEEFAPPGHYFGIHEGDGSDFGFWPTSEVDDEESHAVVLLYPETPEFTNFHHRVAYFYVQARGREEAVRKALEDALEFHKHGPELTYSDMTVVCVVKGNPVFI